MKYSILLWLILFSVVAELAGQEVIVNTWPDQTGIYILLPYDLFFFSAETNKADYQLNINLMDSTPKNVYQNTFYLNLDKDSTITGTTQVREFYGNFKPGQYNLVILLRNIKFGDKKEKQFKLIIPESGKVKIADLIIAKTGSNEYTPSEYKDLNRDLTACELILDTFTICDSIILKAVINQQEQRVIMPRNSGNFFNLLPLLQQGPLTGMELMYYANGEAENTGDLLHKVSNQFNQTYLIKDQLSQIKYIANQNEWKIIRKIAQKDPASAVNYFWDQHNNSPGSNKNDLQKQFQERVEMADHLFTIHKKMPGWKSDRGRIYIIRGAPDDVVEETFPIGTYSYILWYYYKENLVFRFIDKTGFGNYTLESEYYEN